MTLLVRNVVKYRTYHMANIESALHIEKQVINTQYKTLTFWNKSKRCWGWDGEGDLEDNDKLQKSSLGQIADIKKD